MSTWIKLKSLFYFIEKKQEGQSLIEFAIVLPVLLLVVFGIIQFGIIFNAQITLTHAAREGARVAVVGYIPAEYAEKISDEYEDEYEALEQYVKDKVLNSSQALLLEEINEDEDIDISIEGGEFEDGGYDINDELTVKVDGEVQVVVPLIGIALKSPFPLSASSTMRVEGKPHYGD